MVILNILSFLKKQNIYILPFKKLGKNILLKQTKILQLFFKIFELFKSFIYLI